MITLAIANHKGGVGKTATAHALGEALAQLGRRVLLVDADPQSSLTLATGTPTGGESLADVFAGDVEASAVIVDLAPGLALLPADLALAEAELLLAAEMGRENFLRRALDSVAGRYDVALVDCPPSLGLLTVNALKAADAVIIPTQPQAADLRGLKLFLGTLERVRERLNPGLQVLGILPTFADDRLLHHQSGLLAMERGGLPLFQTAIGRTVRIAEAAAEGESIVTFEPQHKQAEAYRQLAEEVNAWLRKEKAT